MNSEYIIAPDTQKLDVLIEKGKGLIKMITLAPENEGALEFIKYACERGVYVSLGHTNATYDEAKKAVEAGVMAGKLVGAVSAVAGGKGGGRPDFAMAGAKDVSLVDKALDAAKPFILENLK